MIIGLYLFCFLGNVEMRILYVISTLKKGGAERLALDICNNIAGMANVEVMLLVMHEQNEYPELSENIKIRYCASSVILSFWRRPKADMDDFLKIIHDFKPDIIHSHLFEAEFLSRWIILPNITYVTHCHDNIKQFKKLGLRTLLCKHRLTQFYERNVMFKKYKACGNNFLAISNDTKHYLERNLPGYLHKIMLMPNAIDVAKFMKQEHKFDHESENQIIKLINIGSFEARKNQSFLIEVARIMADKGQQFCLTLIGSGMNKSEVEKKIIHYGLSDRIFSLGNVSNVERLLNDADIYVHAAIYEAFGLVMLEAMAAGLPVVCLDGMGNRDFMLNGKNGFILSEPDPVEFADRIIDLVNNRALYRQMADFALNFVKQYDINAYVANLVLYYQKLMNEL